LRRSALAASARPARLPRRIAVIAGTLVIVGCASTLAPRESTAVRFPEARNAYEIAGRISARHDAEAFAASFHWSHAENRDELDFASPLGQTVARLTGDARGVQLQTQDGKAQTANDWTTLTSRGLGWVLPVDGLASWIQGVPRRDAPFKAEAGDDGLPAVLRQDGWTIVYQAFASDASGAPRPARMTLDYPGVALRVVIDTWQ
jgi:outer membrane lipoprotein LolB